MNKDFDKLLWEKIQKGIDEKGANHLLALAKSEYKKIVAKNEESRFFIASDIVTFMREKGICYTCQGRLPSLCISYLLDFTEFDPTNYNLLSEYYFDSNRYVMFGVENGRKNEVEQYLLENYNVVKLAKQDDSGKIYRHAPSYLIIKSKEENFPPIAVNGEECVYVGKEEWFKQKVKDNCLSLIYLIGLDALDEIGKGERAQGLCQKDYGLFDDKEVFDRIRRKRDRYLLLGERERIDFSKRSENSIKALAQTLAPNKEDVYLPHFICYATLIYKQAFLDRG